MTAIKIETMPVAVAPGEFSELTRVRKDASGTPVLLLHGLMEDRRIFLPPQGEQGLARYLAGQGYDVFIAELRGRRQPGAALRRSGFGLHQAINEDLPAMLRVLEKYRPQASQLWCAHGWGGVLLSSFLARYPDWAARLQGIVHFAANRVSLPDHALPRCWERWLWRHPVGALVRLAGYLPAGSLRFGLCNETARFYRDSVAWLYGGAWIDPHDGFDYAAAVRRVELPPSLYFATVRGGLQGLPDAVRAFMREQGAHNGHMVTLGRKLGNRRNYSPVGMLTHQAAVGDHFPWLLQWLARLPSRAHHA